MIIIKLTIQSIFYNKSERDVPSIEKYFKDYEIKKIEKAGHVIHFDNPEHTIKSIDSFINKK